MATVTTQDIERVAVILWTRLGYHTEREQFERNAGAMHVARLVLPLGSEEHDVAEFLHSLAEARIDMALEEEWQAAKLKKAA